MGPLYVRCSYSTWISCRGVSGFATDCPCDVWCRGLTICLLHVGPPFGNRFFNTSRAVGLTYGIVYLHFYVFWHIQLYMSWYIISFFGFIFTSLICFIFLRTPALTSSIDVVFALSIFQIFTYNDILNNLTKCKRDKRCIPVVVIHSLFSSPNFLFINISSTTFVELQRKTEMNPAVIFWHSFWGFKLYLWNEKWTGKGYLCICRKTPWWMITTLLVLPFPWFR